MNLDELESPVSPISAGSDIEEDSKRAQLRNLPVEIAQLSSASPDNDWVSPFTILPPLPTLRKNQQQSNLLRSPNERIHQRSASSAYYAAAWGSPYATPSPNRSPNVIGKESDSADIDPDSPLAVREGKTATRVTQALPTSKHPDQRDSVSSTTRRRASSWDRQKALSERFNWLSESDHSEGEAEDNFGKTPTRNTYLKSWDNDFSASSEKSSLNQHQFQESVSTITPETFNGASEAHVKIDQTLACSPGTMEHKMAEDMELRSGSDVVDKPLPSLPSQVILDTKAGTAAPSENVVQSPSRPRLSSTQSFQYPKKKVAWKGRTCVIAIPLTDRQDAGLPPLLNKDEIERRLQRWTEEGYETKGFTLAPAQATNSAGSGQSRSPYPDPIELRAERSNGKFNVYIPDQAEWNAWVDYLKEEKLRALGVTPSNSEAPLSTQSPFSSSLSRMSSQFASLAASPPVNTISVNGSHPRIANNTFSPALSQPGGMSSQGGSHVPSPLGGLPGSMHAYKQSITYMNGHPQMKSPFDYSAAQQNNYGPGLRQTPNGFAGRQFSPPNTNNMQSLGQVLSPAIPSLPPAPVIPSNGHTRGASQSATMDQIRQQQQRQQQIHSQMLQNQHQRQQSMFPQPSKSADLPRTPNNVLESPTRSTPPEIMHPTPRSHRHNLSAALQKGIDEAEAEAAQSSQSSVEQDKYGRQLDTVQDGEDLVEEADEQEQELPVLRRPETMADDDGGSEIETNPSIAASPLLVDNEKNPFRDLNTLEEIMKTQNEQKTHKPKPSISRFNVEAPVFDPTKGFSFTPPVVDHSSVLSTRLSNSAVTPAVKLQHTSNKPSISKFNIAAPTFVPSFMKQDTPQTSAHSTPAKTPSTANKSAFTFGSSTFNVEAPEFKPGQSFSFSAPSFTPTKSLDVITNFGALNTAPLNSSSGSIFGNVIVDASTRVSRRGANLKSLPVVKPRSRDASPVEVSDNDDEGRPNAPTDRQKRARRGGSDGDRVPLFADSAPFTHIGTQSLDQGEGHDEEISSNPTSEDVKPIAEVVSGPSVPTRIEAQVSSPKQTTSDELDQIISPDVDEVLQEEKSSAQEDNHEEATSTANELEQEKEQTDRSTDLQDTQDDADRSDSENIVEVIEETSDSEESKQDFQDESDLDNVVEVIEERSDGSEIVEVIDTSLHDSASVENTKQRTSIADVLSLPEVRNAHSKKSSLSALAPPFEFKPPHTSSERRRSLSRSSQPDGDRSSRKPSGLGASKFATSPSPPTQLAGGLQASRFATVSQSTVVSEAQPSHDRDSIIAKTSAVGLQASKFAASRSEPSPPPSQSVGRKASRSNELYEYVEPKDLDQDLAEQGLLHEFSDRHSSISKLDDEQYEQAPEQMRSIERSFGEDKNAEELRSSSRGSQVDDNQPSYEEIDAVMRQFEDNPDLGVERDDTPVKATPLIDMRIAPPIRSDAPSPSPGRRTIGHHEIDPRRRVADFGLGIHRLNDSTGEVSDWGHDYSPEQEQRIKARAGFFDEHVNDLVDGLLEQRLGPLERSLSTIQHSLALMTPKNSRRGRRSMSTDKQESDADDEDDYNAYEGFSQYRSRSPVKRDRKADIIRSAIADAMSVYQQPYNQQPVVDNTELLAATDILKQLSHQTQHLHSQDHFKAMIEDAISNHPHLRSIADENRLDNKQNNLEAELNDLRALLKTTEQQVDEEVKARQQAEDNVQLLNSELVEARDKASSIRNAHDQAQTSLKAFAEEKEAYSNLKEQLDNAQELNNEYRLSRKDWEQQIESERLRNRDLIFALKTIRQQHSDQEESRKALQDQLGRLQARMSQVVHDLSSDEAEWHKRELGLIVQTQKLQAAFDHETQHRQKAELELDDLDKEHKENLRFRVLHENSLQESSRLHTEISHLKENNHELLGFKSMYENSQQESARLHAEISRLREENKVHQDTSFRLERELAHANETTDVEIAKHTARMQADIDAANNLRSDYEAQIERLKARLDTAEIDLEDQKANHDSAMAEASDTHGQALREANEKRENALEEQHTAHQTKLNDLRERHTRALHNSSDDRHRLEYHLNEKLTFSEDKIKHLEGKVVDLEERLDVTKSAARAAVEAVTAKGVDVPTPAPSVVASPPQKMMSASLTTVKELGLPEKISPQALRESIMVLQDQLQNREHKIEELERDLAAVDRDAPIKIKERDSEITMLRELLAVRVDDLNEIISTVSKPDFNRETIRDAAIRLKATLQMEQQLKERAAAISNLASNLPSISSITNLAPSPRGLPMAAVAAFGNWRKAKDSGMNAFNNFTGNLSDQTPSKSKNVSPSSFMTGIMTPPSTSQRTPTAGTTNTKSPPSMRPLAIAGRKNSNSTGPQPRPLRTYSSQPRTLSSQQTSKRRDSVASSNPETGKKTNDNQNELPVTPTTVDQDASSGRSLDFDDDVDEDASPFDDSNHQDQQEEESISDPTSISTVTKIDSIEA